MDTLPSSAPVSDPAPLPPEPLPDDACCGNGCDPCVFDLYYAELDRYRAALRAWQARQADKAGSPETAGP
jgi:Oxidoreductase-like protein, N-terminal